MKKPKRADFDPVVLEHKSTLRKIESGEIELEEDPRKIISKAMKAFGVSDRHCDLIGMEAGASQCRVDRAYLSGLRIKGRILDRAVSYMRLYYELLSGN